MAIDHACESIYCELHSLSDDEEVTIEFADAEGNTLEMHTVNPRTAEEIIYDWCVQHLDD